MDLRLDHREASVSDNSVAPFLPRICSSEDTGGCGSLLPSAFSDVRSSDDVIAFEGRSGSTL